MEENFEIIPKNTIDYIFSIEKAAMFMEVINQLPEEEIENFNVRTLTRLKAIVFESPRFGSIENRECLFSVITDFKKEHAHIRTMAEQESIFYAPIEQTTLFGEFLNFLPASYSPELLAYLESIGKATT